MSFFTDKHHERHPALMADMANARCIGDMAGMIMLARTGIEFDEARLDQLQEDVAAVAEEYDATPDDVQTALERHEPELAIGAID